MAQLMDYVHYLTKEIGPRPAGTEEEQQAALYITEQFQKEAGFAASIEDFSSTSNLEGGNAVLAAVTVVVTLLAMIFVPLSIPAFILAAAAAALYVLEAFDRPILSSRLARGASQNVIAKYQPNPDAEASGRMRSRKLIVVAHYDTGRVKPPIIARLEATGLPLQLICVIGMVVAAFFLLLRIFISAAGGGALVVLNILTVLALIVCLYPILKAVLTRTAAYNEGANNNATGTAALIEVARRISRGSVSEADLAQGENGEVTIHGEEAARSEGLIPEGAQLLYEAEQIAPPAEIGEYDEEERLLAAKAAIAALTGTPVERKVYGSVADKLVNSRAHSDHDADYDYDANADYGEYAYVEEEPSNSANSHTSVNEPVAAMPLPSSQPAPAPAPASDHAEGFENAPSWFIAAQQNAKKSAPEEGGGEIHRSRYTEAMEQGERARREREEALYREQQERAEAEARAREEEASAAAAAYAQNLQVQAAMQAEAPVPEQEAEAVAFDEHAAAVEQTIDSAQVDDQRDLQEKEDARPVFEPAFEEDDFPDDPMLQIAYERGVRTMAVSDDEGSEEAIVSASIPEVTDVEPAVEEHVPADPGQTRAFPGYAELDARAQQDAQGADDAAADVATDVSATFAPDEAVEPAEIKTRARHAISLPELDLGQPSASAPASRGYVTDLPSISTPANARREATASADPEREDRLRNLRTNVPSLSGVIRERDETRRAVASSLPSVLNVPTPVEDKPQPEERPLEGEELKAPAPRRLVTDDEVDYDMEVPAELGNDYEYEENAAQDVDADIEAEADADAENDSFPTPRPRTSMPKSRAGGFLNRFRHNKEEDLDDTPQEWLNIDEDFDARSVGRARGSWESFRDERFEDTTDDFLAETEEYGEFSTNERRSSKRKWEGGAYSRMSLGHVDMRSGEDAEADEVIPDEPPEAEIGRSITGEIEQIYHFRNPSFSTEIWFVAIGSDTDAHDGAKAFLEAHRNELRGSMVIEVESLGAGTLSVASQEGTLRKVTASSRIKRLTRDVIAKTGISLDEVSLAGTDSIASTVQKAGFQSMHLFGAEDGKPALKGSVDDVAENIDELAFDDNVNFLFELLKNK